MAFVGKNAAGANVSFKSSTSGSDEVPHKILDAGESHIGQVGGHTFVKIWTPSIPTGAVDAGDVLADTEVIASFFRKNDNTGTLQDLYIVDKSDSKANMVIFVHDTNVSMGTENSAPSMSDADAIVSMPRPIVVNVSDWFDIGGACVAYIPNIGMTIKSVSGAATLPVSVVLGSAAATFGAVDALVFRFGGYED